jgi:transposase
VANRLLAAIGVGKFREYLPLYRQEDILFRQGGDSAPKHALLMGD